MINQSFYRVIPTSLDINGPVLSFTQTPSGISGQVGDTVSFVGVATAVFLGTGNTATPTGSIAYRWYEGSVALSDGNRLSGTATNTLVITNLQTSDASRVFYLEARFNPSAYGSGKNGRAINEPIYSNVVGSGVQLPPPPTASLSASSTSIAYNGSVTLNWSTGGANNLTSNFGRSELNGSITISNLTSSVTYQITASNQGGSTTRSVTVNVGSAPPPPPPPSGPFLSFGTSTGGSIAYGGTIVFTITTFDTATLTSNFGYSKSGLGGNLLNDSVTLTNVTLTKTYNLTATGTNGVDTLKQLTVLVDSPPASPTIDSFSASPTTIISGNSSTLSWTTTNATSVSINQGIGGVSVDGSTSVTPTTTTTYTLTATGPGGTVTSSVTITVNPPSAPTASLSASSTSIAYNGSTTLTWSTSGATSLTSNFGETALSGSLTISNLTSSVTYEINATNAGGTTTKRVTINVGAKPAPTASLSASPSSIANGGSTTLTWSTSDADTLTSNFGRSELNGSITISNLISSVTYQIFASNAGGTTTRDATVTVAAPAPVIRITTQPSNTSATYNKCTGSGGSVTFSVGATVDNAGSAVPSYQWYLNGSALSNGTNVSGAQNSTLTLKVLENQGGNNTVYVRVSYSGASTVQSNTVNYIVNVIEPRPVITQTAGLPLDKTVFVGETATFDITASASDGRALNYQWSSGGNPLIDGTFASSFPNATVSGSKTSKLSITPSNRNSSGMVVYAIITDPSSTCTASNSPFDSELATLTVNERTKIIKAGGRGDESTSISYADVNLSTFTFSSGANYEFYSPFEDIVVDIKMEGGRGRDIGNFRGGEGGIAIVRLTLRQNTEYIIRALPSNNGNGGGGCFLYEQARLIAVCGGGGGAGTNGNGGRGGGAGIYGENGSGSGSGSGGTNSARSLGYFPGGDSYCDTNKTSIVGGIVSSCTIGDPSCAPAAFWRTNYSPCGNYGNSALNINGQSVSGAALISRGFKGGTAHRNNGGYAQSSNDGAGGSGCGGGNAANIGSAAGGGGAGGYASGVSVVDARLGGRTTGTTGQWTIALAGRLSL